MLVSIGEALLILLNAAKGEVTTQAIYERLEGKYKPISLSSIFLSLDRMKKKKLVAVRKGDPRPRRGGKALLYYKITDAGRAAVEEAEALRDTLGSPAQRPPSRSARRSKTPER